MTPPSEAASLYHRAGTRLEGAAWVDAPRGIGPLTWDRLEDLEAQPDLRRRLVDASCRGLNVLVALVLLTLALPLMIVIGLAIWLTSPGPVIYLQDRVGLDRRQRERELSGDRREQDVGGRLFKIYKFRTMYQNDTPQVWAAEDDPRITPVGGLLRRYRLDELPQLLNVLKGDMNIVGPRPEQPRIFQDLRTEIDRYPNRQRVLPGITGLAQVNQGYDVDLDTVRRKLDYDLEYIRRRSPLEDLRIMTRTPSVMFYQQDVRN